MRSSLKGQKRSDHLQRLAQIYGFVCDVIDSRPEGSAPVAQDEALRTRLPRLLRDIEESFYSQRAKYARCIFLVYSTAFMVSAVGAGAFALSSGIGIRSGEANADAAGFALTPAGWFAMALFGSVGAFASVFQRSGQQTVDPAVGPKVLFLEAQSRMLLGCIAALLVVLAVDSGVLLGSVVPVGDTVSSFAGALLLCCLAGGTERLVPTLVSRVDPAAAGSAEAGEVGGDTKTEAVSESDPGQSREDGIPQSAIIELVGNNIDSEEIALVSCARDTESYGAGGAGRTHEAGSRS